MNETNGHLRPYIPLVDALVVPLSLHDLDGRFVHMNPAAEKAIGRSNSDVAGRPLTTFVSPEDQARVTAQFRRAVEHGTPSDFVTGFVDAHGDERFAYSQQIPLKPDGHVIGVLIFAWQALVPSGVTEEDAHRQQLTRRQLEVLRLVASGWSTPEIADELNLAHPTVRNHLSDILAQLDAHSRVEAIAKAQRAGLLALRPLEPARGRPRSG